MRYPVFKQEISWNSGIGNMKKIQIIIDLERTGKRLKAIAVQKGYSVKSIQEYLGLSCPQPIYRWYKGMILPSVDHLLMLSELYQVHMEDLLVKKNIKLTMNIEDREEKSDIISDLNFTKRTHRIQAYFLKLYA